LTKGAGVTAEEFARSLGKEEAPVQLGPALCALWWAGKRDWERAHALVMDDESAAAAWVHAHLHRIESDLGNAAYWYRRAGQPVAGGPLEDEWTAIAAALLAGANPKTRPGDA
jgi:hypothetical protein